MLIAEISIIALIGLVLGFLQSLLAGIYARSWDGGTGILWGLIIAVPSGIAAAWLGWDAIWMAAALALIVLVLSLLSIYRDKKRVPSI